MPALILLTVDDINYSGLPVGKARTV